MSEQTTWDEARSDLLANADYQVFRDFLQNALSKAVELAFVQVVAQTAEAVARGQLSESLALEAQRWTAQYAAFTDLGARWAAIAEAAQDGSAKQIIASRLAQQLAGFASDAETQLSRLAGSTTQILNAAESTTRIFGTQILGPLGGGLVGLGLTTLSLDATLDAALAEGPTLPHRE
jgi:hypothetical protein